MNQTLHHIVTPSKFAKNNLVCLHGLMGSSNNFRSILKNKKINDQVTSYSVDLRNHGKSFHSSKMSSLDMADDVYKFVQSNQLDNLVFMGHSLGGVVVSSLASNYPDLWDITKGFILVDISPVNPHLLRKNNEIRSILEKLAYYQPVGKHYKQIKQEIYNACNHQNDIAGLIMTNISGNESIGYSWSCNNYTLAMEYDNYINAHQKEICPVKMKLIYGKESRHIHKGEAKPEMFDSYFSNFDPKKDFVGIEGAGHWVHAQKPYEFIDTLSEMLSDIINN